MIGAGASSIGLLYQFRNKNIHSIVFEKARGIGGRTTTRRFENNLIDHGANYLTLD